MDYSIEAKRFLKDDPQCAVTACPVCDAANREPQSLYFAEQGQYGCSHCGEHPWSFFAPQGWMAAERG